MEDNQSPLQVEIDESVARGQYTNLALITHSETEFLLDFLFLQPQTTKSKVLTRLITSPVTWPFQFLPPSRRPSPRRRAARSIYSGSRPIHRR